MSWYVIEYRFVYFFFPSSSSLYFFWNCFVYEFGKLSTQPNHFFFVTRNRALRPKVPIQLTLPLGDVMICELIFYTPSTIPAQLRSAIEKSIFAPSNNCLWLHKLAICKHNLRTNDQYTSYAWPNINGQTSSTPFIKHTHTHTSTHHICTL